MKSFMVVEEQAGEGCDYTIGCGVACYMVKANSVEELLDVVHSSIAAMQDIDDQLSSSILATGERERESIVIYEIASEQEVGLQYFQGLMRGHLENIASNEAEDKERQEYNRLKKKFA